MEIKQGEISCCSCKVTFWVTKKHKEQLGDCHNTFYCPNGHPQSYVGKSDEQKYKEEQQRNEHLEDRNNFLAQSNAALRGVITKMRKKQKGVLNNGS